MSGFFLQRVSLQAKVDTEYMAASLYRGSDANGVISVYLVFHSSFIYSSISPKFQPLMAELQHFPLFL